jgi:hypothetical protein
MAVLSPTSSTRQFQVLFARSPSLVPWDVASVSIQSTMSTMRSHERFVDPLRLQLGAQPKEGHTVALPYGWSPLGISGAVDTIPGVAFRYNRAVWIGTLAVTLRANATPSLSWVSSA